MVDPGQLSEPSAIFVCGDDGAAKQETADVLESFGWRRADIVDLGDISASRGVEMFLPLWLRLYGAEGTGQFNLRVVRA